MAGADSADGNPYVVPTGEGYLGIISVWGHADGIGADLSRTYLEEIGVGAGDSVAVESRSDRLVLWPVELAPDEADRLRKTTRSGGGWRRKSGCLGLWKSLDSLGLQAGADVRIYRRDDPPRLVLVPRENDPFLDEEEGP